MCIAAIAWQLFTDMPLVLLSNRDEFIERPTLALHRWGGEANPQPIIAGQDKRAGGTWLGINATNGRWGVILNYRQIDPQGSRPIFATSRGDILVDFLLAQSSPLQFARQLDLMGYDGFNLVIGDRQQAVMLNNRGYGIEVLANGLYVLSNGQPDDAWFKTERLRSRVRQEVLPLIAEQQNWQAAALNVLHDSEQAPVAQLPVTGLPQAAELALSSIFIPQHRLQGVFAQAYGTVNSTLLTVSQSAYWVQEQQYVGDQQVTMAGNFIDEL